MAEKPNILIAVPAYGGTVETNCMAGIVSTVDEIVRRGWVYSVRTIDKADIVTVRNIFGSIFYAKRAYTHMLFVDADIGFRADLVMRLLEERKEFIGYLYQKRTTVPGLACSGQPRLVERDIYVVDGIGLGLCMISRPVFDRIAATGKLRKTERHIFTDYLGSAPLYGFFDHVYSKNAALLEDVAFCWRWRTFCGGV